jgi:hypothetical protein
MNHWGGGASNQGGYSYGLVDGLLCLLASLT